MKFIQLCALFIGAFLFLQPVNADPAMCPDGGTFQVHSTLGGICSTPAPEGILYTAHGLASPMAPHIGTGPSVDAALEALKSKALSALGSTNQTTTWQILDDESKPVTCSQTQTVTHNINYTNVSSGRQYYEYIKTDTRTISGNYRCGPGSTSSPVVTGNIWAPSPTGTGPYCPPDEYPKLTGFFEESGASNCYAAAKPKPPCDCTDLAGEPGLPYSSFLAKKDAYVGGNEPQCLNVKDNESGASCDCQFVAKKWLWFNAGSQHVRWEPYPTENGGITGTYTGAACNADASDIAPPPEEKEECFTLKSGVSWCWADPKERCTIVNGQEQCDSGCGYINGDFVCYEDDKPPVIPPEQQDKKPIDDDITDPNKSMADMVKGDFKDINRGIEQRLDNVIISADNNNATLQAIEGEAKETNAKLDGIGKQLDGQGKTLKGIEKGIGDAFGDEGSPDGACEGECTGSWYESAYPNGMVGIWQEHSEALQQTPMFGFLNQFQISPSGTQPDLNVCFNFGSMGDFGCSSFEIPAIIWPFIKIVILITAAYLCRALIFGG